MNQAQPTRKPKPSFSGRNGFTERSDAPTESGRVYEALDRYRFAQFVLKDTARPVPTLQEMKDYLDKPDDLVTINELIEEVKRRHQEDLSKLFAWQAEEYHTEVSDMNLNRDDTQYLVKGENNPIAVASYAKLESLYKTSRQGFVMQATWDDSISRLKYAYLKTILPLYERRAKLESQFPQSIREFRALRDLLFQLHAAKFLVADIKTKDALLTKNGWAWRQVTPLMEEYENNEDFRAEIEDKIEKAPKDPRKLRAPKTKSDTTNV